MRAADPDSSNSRTERRARLAHRAAGPTRAPGGGPDWRTDTGGMWVVVRVVALAVLALMGVLLLGHGDWLFDLIDRAAGLVGAGPVTPRADAGLSAPAALAGVAVGLGAALTRPANRAVGQLVTLLHELGHTVVAAALGGRPAGIVLRHDASGHATARWGGHAGLTRRLALAAVAFAGLPAAAVVSAAGAHLLLLAGPEAVLWAFAIAGGAVAVLARSAWSVLVAGGLVGLAVAALHDAVAPWVGAAMVALLVATSARAALDALRTIGRPLRPGEDARVVARNIRLPAGLVRLVQVAACAVLSVWAVWLLLTAPPGLGPLG